MHDQNVTIVRRDNPIVWGLRQRTAEQDETTGEVSYTVAPLDLTNVTRMLFYVVDQSGEVVSTIDSAETPAAITWEGSKVTIQPGPILTEVPPRAYWARLTAIDSFGETSELVHEKLPSQQRLIVGAAEAV